MVKVRASRAFWRVVELDENEVEPRSLQRVSQVCVWDNALRCARNVVSLAEILSEVGAQCVDHCTISFVFPPLWCQNTLDVKVEPINNSVTKWSGNIGRWIFGAESLPEEISELHSALVVLDVLVVRDGTTKRQQDRLALALTVLDIMTKMRAMREKGAVRAIGILKCLVTARVSEVRAWISATLIWENVQKGDIDDIDAVILTIVPETLLVCSLALSKYN